MSTNGRTAEAEYGIDVGALRVARTYAEALLNAAKIQGTPDDVLEELDGLVHQVFPANPQLELFLYSRAIGRDKKEAVIEKVFQGRVSETFLRFLLVLNAHDRLDLTRALLVEAREIHEKRTGRIRVHVRSAAPLGEEQRQRLISQLRDQLHKEPVLQTQVVPDLLGGLVVRVGDWLYDASVRTRLETLRNQLIERSSYEIQRRRDSFVTRT